MGKLPGKPVPPPAPPRVRVEFKLTPEQEILQRNIMAASIYGGSLAPGDAFTHPELIAAAYRTADAMLRFTLCLPEDTGEAPAKEV